ncbi:hypothetical protein SGLAM104S_06973 [Streptomyces glaucescens]
MKTIVRPSSRCSRTTSSCMSSPDQARVEGAERLVEEQHLGVHGQGPGQTDALLLAAGELARPPLLHALKADLGDDLGGLGAPFGRPAGCPGSPGRRRHCRGPVRCGSRPKCWKTIAARCRRSSRSRALSMARTSSPSMAMVPAVRLDQPGQQRTRVDLPEPDRPMTTKTSPLRTSKEDVLDGRRAAGAGAQLGGGEGGQFGVGGDPVRLGAEHLPQAVDREGRAGVRVSGVGWAVIIGRHHRSGRRRLLPDHQHPDHRVDGGHGREDGARRRSGCPPGRGCAVRGSTTAVSSSTAPILQVPAGW